ncbi:MAG: PA2778 family cysteine peptidase [Kiloniellales bacterium]
MRQELGRRADGIAPAYTLLLAILLTACAAPQTQEILADFDNLPARAEVTGVPFYPQEDYYCGPAALATVLTWSGDPVTQHDMVPEVYSPERKGTLRSDLLAAARRHGRLAVPIGDMKALLSEIAAGHPVLVFQNLALDLFPQWHYAVAYGYDLEQREIVLRSGTHSRWVADLSAFERTWERGDYWALVVLPPERLPATADQRAALAAAVALERVERPNAAAQAYRAVLSRWPDSFAAHMGLGNALYAQQAYAGADRAFRAAIRQRPDDPAPWNNLAHVLAALGRPAEARQAAEEAVRLAPGDAAPYRDTLRELTGGKS